MPELVALVDNSQALVSQLRSHRAVLQLGAELQDMIGHVMQKFGVNKVSASLELGMMTLAEKRTIKLHAHLVLEKRGG